MVLDKYIKINEKQIIAGQTAAGVWYCKELPANTTKELRNLISEINIILNKANEKEEIQGDNSQDKKGKK